MNMNSTSNITNTRSEDTQPHHQKTLTKFGYFINGACSSSAMILCLQPIVTTKTFLMSGKGFPPIWKLYRGLTPSLSSIVPLQSISFFIQGALVNRYFDGNRENLTSNQKIILGLSSGASTSVLATCFDRVMIQQQLNGGGPLDTIRRIIKYCGLRGLIKGYFPTLIRESFFSMTLFGLSDIFVDGFENLMFNKSKKHETYSSLCGRIAAGMIAGILTTPIDVIKTRMQGDLENKYSASRQTISMLIKSEGPRSLIKGIWIRMGMISSAIVIMGYAKEYFPTLFPESFYEKG